MLMGCLYSSLSTLTPFLKLTLFTASASYSSRSSQQTRKIEACFFLSTFLSLLIGWDSFKKQGKEGLRKSPATELSGIQHHKTMYASYTCQLTPTWVSLYFLSLLTLSILDQFSPCLPVSAPYQVSSRFGLFLPSVSFLTLLLFTSIFLE